MKSSKTPKGCARLLVLAVLSIGLFVAPAGAQSTTVGTVVAWGCDGADFGQCTAPVETASGVTAIAAGQSHSLALQPDGGVLAWGCGGLSDAGQCTVPAAASHDVAAIAAGDYHSLALAQDGDVLAWGCGAFAGSGPCRVPSAATSGVAAIAAGASHSLAVKGGGVLAWGCGFFAEDSGQCDVPAAAASGVTAVAGGVMQSLALKADGSIVAWGCHNIDDAGQCTVPAAAASGVTALAAGRNQSLALKQDGSVVAWGCRGFVAFGPCSVPAAATIGVKAIAAADSTNVALKQDGSVVVWGNCGAGQCAVPADAASGVAAVVAASSHVLALRAAGDARADLSLVESASPDPAAVGETLAYDFTIANGGPQDGERILLHDALPLGLSFADVGTITGGGSCHFATPGRVVECSWSSLASGASVHVQILATANRPGRFVNAATVRSATIDPDSTNNSSTATVEAQLARALGLVVPWGCGATFVDRAQCDVPAGLSGVTAVAAAWSHSVALKSDGTVVAWGCGEDDFGQCRVPAGLADVTSIAAGFFHSLALKSDGTVVAWGCGSSPDRGQCRVPDGLANVTAIAAGFAHSLALEQDGTVVAWGCGSVSDDVGQCSVPSDLSGVTAIAAGDFHSLALKSDGTVVAWGCGSALGWSTDQGQCDVPAGLSGVTAISAGFYDSLALKSDGTVVAWGCGIDFGQCDVPAGLSGVKAISAAWSHSLALKNDGTVVAWGCNFAAYGQCSVPDGLSGVTALAAGSGVQSLAVVTRTSPGAPTNVAAIAGAGQATVNWTAPDSDGGSAVTGYEITRYAGGVAQGTTTTGAVTQATVTGLTNGTTYTFKVAATNAVGTGPQSAESNAVTPSALRYPLTVTKSGAGTGTVTSDVGGLDCGATCTALFDQGTTVRLTATPASGFTFAGWIGDCSGSGACTLTMDRSRSATAVFGIVTGPPKTLTIGRAGTGAGSTVMVYPGGFSDCFSSCARDFAYGTVVKLAATAAAGSTFTGWNGDCSGTGGCTLTMDQHHSATAVFTLIAVPPVPKSLTVSKAGTGAGTVTSSPDGIECGSTCTREFAHGTQVTLTGTAAAGSTFAGWSGACSGTGACTVTLDAAKAVTGTFNQVLKPVSCVVPNVKGKPLATAKRLLKAAHCAAGKVTKAKSKTVAKGKVISQSPKAGKKLAGGAKVKLVVSRGSR